MAYDKVVDSAVLNAGLTQIANAIREKAGTSDSLEFPAAMAEAIAAIEAGGGKIATGTITTSSDTSSNITITHGLGVVPDWFAMLSNSPTGNKMYSFVFGRIGKPGTYNEFYYAYTKPSDKTTSISYASTSSLTATSGFGYYFNMTEQEFVIKQKIVDSSYGIGENTTWAWIAVGGVE